MITEAKLDDVFSAMATAISITIIRANQKVKKLPRVYGTYNLPVEEVESLHQSEVTVADAGSRNAAVSRWEASRASITLKFYGDRSSDWGALKTAISNAINWVAITAVADVVMRVITTQVRDETAFIEQNYQYVRSFDMRIDSCEARVNTVEALERVEATPTVDDVVQPVIIIDQNNS